VTVLGFLGLHVTSTLVALFFLNALLAYSAYPVFALGRMNLAFMAFAGVGAYTAAILHLKHGIPPALAIAAGVALSALAALPVGAVLGRVRGIYVAIASVNLVVAFQITVGGLPDLTGGALGLLGLPIVATQTVLGVSVAAVVAFFWLFSRSRPGRAIRVQRSDPLLALATGVNTVFNASALFVLSAAVGGLAGSLQVFWYGFVSPEFYGFQGLLLVLAMVVVGGTGSWLGPLVGAAFFTIVPEWLRFAGGLSDVLVGGILLAVVLFAPEGIAGTIDSRLRLWRARSSVESRARRASTKPPLPSA
jgi:branched-chain amino acid transport system permease protein